MSGITPGTVRYVRADLRRKRATVRDLADRDNTRAEIAQMVAEWLARHPFFPRP